MAEIGQKCIKWLMFIFNLFFLITGLGLIVAGGIAQTNYRHFSDFFVNGSLAAPVLLILVGVAIFIISFLGCCGAVRENYYMLMAFSVLLGLLFIVQVAGGIAAYVERGKLDALVGPGVQSSVYAYYFANTTDADRKDMDTLQYEFSCCGASNYSDWTNPSVSPANQTIPQSCCRNKAGCNTNATETATCDVNPVPETCPIHTRGCERVIRDILYKAIAGVAGVAIGLAVIELIGMVFACYLAKRIRSGYTYA